MISRFVPIFKLIFRNNGFANKNTYKRIKLNLFVFIMISLTGTQRRIISSLTEEIDFCHF